MTVSATFRRYGRTMRVITWRGRLWRAEQRRDGWHLTHGTPAGGYGLILSRTTLDEVVAQLMDEGVDPEADLDT